MLAFIAENLATILIAAVLLAAVVIAVLWMLNNRKKGGCSGGCASCGKEQSCPYKNNEVFSKNNKKRH